MPMAIFRPDLTILAVDHELGALCSVISRARSIASDLRSKVSVARLAPAPRTTPALGMGNYVLIKLAHRGYPSRQVAALLLVRSRSAIRTRRGSTEDRTAIKVWN